MNRRHRLYRALRIIASSVCGVVCVLLVCLWVRSYHTADAVRLWDLVRMEGVADWWSPVPFAVTSNEGRVAAIMPADFHWTDSEQWDWRLESYSVDAGFAEELKQHERLLGFGWIKDPYFVKLNPELVGFDFDLIVWQGSPPRCSGPLVPHWFLILLFASFVAFLWIPWSTRFSLRTLLIAVTLAALTMGAIVYFVRQ